MQFPNRIKQMWVLIKQFCRLIVAAIVALSAIAGILNFFPDDIRKEWLEKLGWFEPTKGEIESSTNVTKKGTKSEPQGSDTFVAPPTSNKQAKNIDQILTDIEKNSNWQIRPELSAYIKDSQIQVLYNDKKTGQAAEIVHRLRKSGAIVSYKFFPNEDSRKRVSGLIYHWNRLQTAQAIQTIVNDITPIELNRNDQAESVTLRIF